MTVLFLSGTARDGDGFVTGVAEQAFEARPDVFLVVNNQDDAASHFLDVLRIQDRLSASRRGFARQADSERSAFFGGGAYVDSSAVRLGDFAGDVQSHADAARAICPRVLGAGAAN